MKKVEVPWKVISNYRKITKMVKRKIGGFIF